MGNIDREIQASKSGWTFSGEVVNKFDSHIEKSVPHYSDLHQVIVNLSQFFVYEDTIVYDLGCSTGKLTHKIARTLSDTRPKARIVGLDVEPKMIEFASSNNGVPNLAFEAADILNYEFERSDFIILNLTLQFVHPSNRVYLLRRIWESLNWGGALILVEKLRGADARFQDIFTKLYADYKQENGFSNDEIVAKERSLRGVMEPYSTKGNRQMLEAAGFEDIEEMFRSIPFGAFCAIK